MGKYKLVPISIQALSDPIKGHKGTFDDEVCACNLINPSSVARPLTEQLDPVFVTPKITVMSFELQSDDPSFLHGPYWFGVSFRSGVTSFDSVNIFFHPVPTNEMPESTYRSRAGGWSKLFRYTEQMGRQLAAASNNQIAIIPMFNPGSWLSTGIFAPNWEDIVTQILTEVKSHVQKAEPSQCLVFRNVVLSDFSRGRENMYVFKRTAPKLNSYLREIWDFDGVTGGPPYSHGSIRGIVYDRAPSNSQTSFHAPPSRWEKYHHAKNLTWEAVHGDFPAMLAYHAATISSVGK